MALDSDISNVVAGYFWVGTGLVGTWWLNHLASRTRAGVGDWRRYFFGPEPGDEARAKVAGLRLRVWSFIAAYLALFLLLDWLF